MVAGHSTLSKGNSRRSELNGALIYRRYRILDEADIERALEKTQESIKRAAADRNVACLDQARGRRA
jgi:hypothetical protein